MISIIIPTLNEEKVLEKTLLSLRQLNSVDYEIIVSDGKSTDKTLEIAQKYADKVVKDEGAKRQTIAGGRNAGAAAARGDYYVFVDADIQIGNINQFFSKALDYFNSDKSIVGLTAFIKVFPEDATWADKLFFSALNIWFYILNNYLHIGTAIGEFQMIKAEAFNKIKGFNIALAAGEDDELFYRLSKEGKTRVEAGLEVFHSSRRAHQIGWPTLLTFWFLNMVFVRIFKRSYSAVWEEVR